MVLLTMGFVVEVSGCSTCGVTGRTKMGSNLITQTVVNGKVQ